MDNNSRQQARASLRKFFFTPPRRHGEVNFEREVSFLELFYDLVYVVIIGQAAHHLATHVSWQGLRDFVIVFGLIWLAWFNGTFWHELHGREDGRSRTNIFVQMGLIALLAVYTGHATDDDGPSFAIVYVILFAWYTYQWWAVHRVDDERYHATTRPYIGSMVATLLAIGASIFVSDGLRLWIWAGVLGLWLVAGFVGTARSTDFSGALTSSMVERFGLFTIVVLGEVVIGVVGGLTETENRSGTTVATAMLGLAVGMGLWWNYFDPLGRRVPSESGVRLSTWVYSHFPLTAAISAAGAAMVSLVEHADDSRTPSATSWLLSGSTAAALLCIALATRALPGSTFPGRLLEQIPAILTVGALAAVAIGALRPPPLVLAGGLLAVLTATWLTAILGFFAAGGTFDPSHAEVQLET